MLNKNTIAPLCSILLATFIISSLFDVSTDATEPQQYKETDRQLKSGDIEWQLEYEVFEPAMQITEDMRPLGLTDEEFIIWKAKQAGYRSQTFQLHAYFQDSSLRFDLISSPGDIIPTSTDQTLAYNGVSVTFIDHQQQVLYRQPVVDSFYETSHAQFFVPPRAFGYDFTNRLRLAQKVKLNEHTPTVQIQNQVPSENAIRILGQYGTESITLVELLADGQYPHLFKSIKFINPQFNDRVSIENVNLRGFNNGIVFPAKSIVTHFLGGSIEDLSTAERVIDRMVFTVNQASFNGEYPDDLFTVALPVGYTDIDNRPTGE